MDSPVPPTGDTRAAPFDYCVITASTPSQAQLYRELVQRRINCGLYPSSLKFRVYPDPPGGRVGSGGGTMVALHELYRQEVGQSEISAEGTLDEHGVRSFFGNHKILLLHAGGESRRLPCYVPEGKLFGPLSLETDQSQSCPPVVLDLLLSLYFRYPWGAGEVVLASGDVIVDFDTAVLGKSEQSRGSICGFGKLASFEQGSRHGVFAFEQDSVQGPTCAVRDFHQKSSPDVLQKECAVPRAEGCALDTGIFAMDADWCLAFFRLAGRPHASGSVLAAVEASELYFDFYLEVVMASLPGQTKEGYLARVASQSKLEACMLEEFLACLAGLDLRGALLPDCAFLHFGTLKEFPEASLQAVQQNLRPFYSGSEAAARTGSGHKASAGSPMVVNSKTVQVQRQRSEEGQVTTEIAWIEMCENIDVSISPGGFHLLVGLQGIALKEPLPPDLCLDGRRLASLPEEAVVVAVYSAKDTFKRSKKAEEVVFCGHAFPSWLAERGLTAADVWDDPAEASAGTELWLAKLFFQFHAQESGSLAGYWLPDLFNREGFLTAKRYSLADLNRLDSALARDQLRSGLLS